MCLAAGQLSRLCNFCQKKGNFARVCLAKNTAGNDSRRHHAHQLRQFASTENTSDSDYVFSLPKSEAARPTVKVTINGVKGRMDADSCSSANIMDIDQYNAIARASAVPICSYNQRICCTHTPKHRPSTSLDNSQRTFVS